MRLQLSALQLNSILGNRALNLETANKLLESFRPQHTCLLVLPELAFTGYNFRSRQEILPLLESRIGCSPSTEWALEAAKRHRTHIIVGFPELCGHSNKIYNTAVFVSPCQKILGYYRKTHLYAQDKQWGCSVGDDGFKHVLGPIECFPFKLQIGICMDLNPKEFTAPFSKREFASALRENGAQVAAVPMAWLASDPPPRPHSPDLEFIEYLKLRQPFPIPTVYANRCGTERGILYAGSSTITAPGTTAPLAYDQQGITSALIDI